MSIILYGSTKKLTLRHYSVRVGDGEYFVRAEPSDLDVGEALDKATPMEGETVLNTVPDGASDDERRVAAWNYPKDRR